MKLGIEQVGKGGLFYLKGLSDETALDTSVVSKTPGNAENSDLDTTRRWVNWLAETALRIIRKQASSSNKPATALGGDGNGH